MNFGIKSTLPLNAPNTPFLKKLKLAEQSIYIFTSASYPEHSPTQRGYMTFFRNTSDVFSQ